MAMIPSKNFCGIIEDGILRAMASTPLQSKISWQAYAGTAPGRRLSRRHATDQSPSHAASASRTRRRSPRGRDARLERALEFILRQHNGARGIPSYWREPSCKNEPHLHRKGVFRAVAPMIMPSIFSNHFNDCVASCTCCCLPITSRRPSGASCRSCPAAKSTPRKGNFAT